MLYIYTYIFKLYTHNMTVNITNQANNEENKNEETIPTNEQMVEFLTTLATNLNINNLSQDDVFLVSEFYMKYNFIQNLSRSGEETTNLLKYLSLGFHIYKNILDNIDDVGDIDEH